MTTNATTAGTSSGTSWGAMTPNKSAGDGGGFEKAPAGNHLAVLVAIIDMGKQWQEGYQGAPGKHQHRAYFCWELVTEKKAGAGNHVIGLDLTMSLNEKAKLRKWVESRRGSAIRDGEPFDILSELGQSCLLNVVMKGEYPKVDGVAAVPKGIPVPPPTYKPFSWSLGEWKEGAPIVLPSWVPFFYGRPLAEQIGACEELKGKVPQGPQREKAAGGSFAYGANAGPDPSSVWFVMLDDGTQKKMTAAEVNTWMEREQRSPGSVYVRPDGTPPHAVKAANEFGFTEPIPM